MVVSIRRLFTEIMMSTDNKTPNGLSFNKIKRNFCGLLRISQLYTEWMFNEKASGWNKVFSFRKDFNPFCAVLRDLFLDTPFIQVCLQTYVRPVSIYDVSLLLSFHFCKIINGEHFCNHVSRFFFCNYSRSLIIKITNGPNFMRWPQKLKKIFQLFWTYSPSQPAPWYLIVQ